METKLKHKAGDKVRVKSLEWYENQPKNTYGNIFIDGLSFVKDMKKYCGKVLKITTILSDYYRTDGNIYCWQDWMFEDEPVDEENQEVK